MRSSFSYRLRRLDRAVRARLALLQPRFGALLAARAPLWKIEYRAAAPTRTLIVFLPGIGDLAEDFERRGFVDELRQHRVAADAVAVDAHFGYYASRAIFERLTDDVITAARRAGYADIWLVGVSLGGFGAACYAVRHHAEIRGLFLIAPYLGDKALTRQIAGAGGMHAWEPGAAAEHDYLRSLWRWFKEHLGGERASPALYLGYGDRDKFASANALLAQALPPERVFVVPGGGHDWRTWRRLWKQFLQGSPLEE